jgi:1,4-alpha-glucan branching enzyme
VPPTIQCEPTKKGDLVKVTFSLPARSDGSRISVVGDFNAWRAGANVFKRRGDLEVSSLTLSSGRRYEFRYVDDEGNWFNDDGAHGYARNEFGEDNSVIDLREVPGPASS